MALRDTWHRTLVYFGLAEEEDPRYEQVRDPEAEVELEDRYRDRPNVRRLQRRRRDEIDDIFADEPRGPGRDTRVLRPVAGNGRGNGGDIQVHLVIPKSFNDAQQIADQYKDGVPVILNLQGTDTDLSLIHISEPCRFRITGVPSLNLSAICWASLKLLGTTRCTFDGDVLGTAATEPRRPPAGRRTAVRALGVASASVQSSGSFLRRRDDRRRTFGRSL